MESAENNPLDEIAATAEMMVYPGQPDLEHHTAQIADHVRRLLPGMAERDLGAVVLAVAWAAYEVNQESGWTASGKGVLNPLLLLGERWYWGEDDDI